jgi:uncharacterized membrane protein
MPRVKNNSKLEQQVGRWVDANIIDAPTGARIVTFESGQERRATLRWPVYLAMAFGGILFAAGVTLFVAAHWADLSPAARFSLVLLMVAAFHAGGAAAADRFPPLSTTLHGIGTATVGAAIFLSGQIFNMRENWATGILLWAIAAACGYLIQRDWVQAAFFALLTPGWLFAQWTITTEWHTGGDRICAMALILIAVCYLSARIGDSDNTVRHTLVWIGGLSLLPCAGLAIDLAQDESYWYRAQDRTPLATSVLIIGWMVAILGPLILAWILRGRAVWINALWAVWAYALLFSARHMQSNSEDSFEVHMGATLALYALCAVGSVGLVAWGLYEKRKERVNLGVAAFAISVLFFYFDSFMGKLGRSAGLIGLGLLCLAGGYVLEITRRKLVAKMEAIQ